MNDWKVYAKTVGAFVATVVGNMAYDLSTGTHPWPTTWQEWLRYGFTSGAAALGAYGARNKITQKQIDKQADIIGAVVVPAVAKEASEVATAAVQDVAASLPKPARDVVQQASIDVGSVVDQVIRDFQNRARS